MERSHIPKMKIETIHNYMSILVILIITSYALFQWSSLPDQVPIHFNLFGKIDRWGSKYFLIAMLSLNVIIYIAMSLSRKYPQKFNTYKKVNQENKEETLINSVLTLSWTKLILLIIFAIVEFITIQTALGV